MLHQAKGLGNPGLNGLLMGRSGDTRSSGVVAGVKEEKVQWKCKGAHKPRTEPLVLVLSF